MAADTTGRLRCRCRRLRPSPIVRRDARERRIPPLVSTDAVRGAHPRVRGAVRPLAAPHPPPGGGALGGVALGDRRPVPGRARTPPGRQRPARPRAGHRVPPHRRDAGGAQGAAAVARPRRARARRGAAAVRGTRPVARTAPRVQDVQGRGRGVRGGDPPQRSQPASEDRSGGAVRIARARSARTRPACRVAHGRAQVVGGEAAARRRHGARGPGPRQRARRGRDRAATPARRRSR